MWITQVRVLSDAQNIKLMKINWKQLFCAHVWDQRDEEYHTQYPERFDPGRSGVKIFKKCSKCNKVQNKHVIILWDS